MKKNNIYALYKGENILGIGTAKELSKKINVKVETIWFWNTATYKRRKAKSSKNNYKIVIKIGDDTDE